jgi:arabinose-5-phosphate isomerase
MAMATAESESTFGAIAADVLRSEAAALAGFAQRSDQRALDDAGKLVLACTGKVVVLGVGKSAIAAAKVASTLTSTGTPAVPLHAADALHGDVGLVCPGDVMLAISNGGETEEVVATVAEVRDRRVPIVAVVGSRDSTLARQADVVIATSVSEEAGPLNLAPTTSFLVTIAVGDALAAALMHARGFTVEDFAANHPAGRLGKRVRLRVSDLMHTGLRNPVVAPSDSWLDVLRAITAGGLGAVSVVDEGRIVGIITDGDVRRTAQSSDVQTIAALRASDFMTPDPITVDAGTLAAEALRIMEIRPSPIAVLPVMDEERRCLGLIRLHDVVQAGLR